MRGGCSAAMEEHEQGCSAQLAALIREENESRRRSDHRALRASSHCGAPNPWREKTSQWCYDVVDHLGESREVVYLAMNVLDRYCVVQSNSSRALKERDYEIAAMTALFLAVRVTGRATLELPQVMRMSRLGVCIHEILGIGKSMTDSLSWDRRLLTPLSFVRAMLDLLDASAELKASLLDSASYLVEVSVCDAFFSGTHPFKVAVAAVSNAIGAGPQCRLSEAQSSKFFRQLLKPHNTQEEISRLQVRLHHIYSQSEENRNVSPHIIMDDDDEADVIVPPIPRGTIRVISSEILHRESPSMSTKTTIVPETEPERVLYREESPSPPKRARST